MTVTPASHSPESSDPPAQNGGVSITALGNVRAYLSSMRKDIVSALMQDKPRLEMVLFTAVIDIFEHKIRPYIKVQETSNMERRSINQDQLVAEGQYIFEHALQDLFASLLFLISKESLGLESKPVSFCTSTVPSCAVRVASPSAFFVSHSQRFLCAQIFFFLSWSPHVRLDFVLSSLYPLLSRSGSPKERHTPAETETEDGGGVSSTSENHIAEDLFEVHRFAWKKKFLVEVLNGLIFSRPYGLRSVHNVFVLSDRIAAGTSVAEAVACINPLLLSNVGTAWVKEKNNTQSLDVVSRQTVEMEESFKTLCDELVQLFTARVDDQESALRSQGTAACGSLSLPNETFEERLHQALGLLCNQLLTLPVKSDPHYAQFYKRYFYANKYFLSPAFGALTLRVSSVDMQSVERALDRFLTLLHSVQLGVSSLSFVVITEVIMTGLLNLMGIMDDLPAIVQMKIQKVFCIIHGENLQAHLVAEIVVRSAIAKTSRHLRVTNRVELELCSVPERCPPSLLVNGLARAVFRYDTAPHGGSSLLKSETFSALLLQCQARKADDHDVGEASEEVVSLLSLVEQYLVEASAECIFGPNATLVAVFRLLNVLVSLSPFCCHWAATFATQVLNAVQSNDAASMPLPQIRDERTFVFLAITKFKMLCAEEFDLGWSVSSVCSEEEFTKLGVLFDTVLVKLNDPIPNDADSGEEGDILEQLSDKKMCIRLAMERGNVSQLSVAISDFGTIVEKWTLSSWGVRNSSLVQAALGREMVSTLAEVLQSSSDTFCAVSAIKALCWMGMYRWDSSDTSRLAELCYMAFLSSHPTPSTAIGEPGQTKAVRLSPTECSEMYKLRLLDLILSWCDYDHQGMTLRNIDDYGVRQYRTSLFQALFFLCQKDQPAAVQVAALHCIGQYFSAVYPRVSLWQLSQLCFDVFRHTAVEMSKAACAAMLVNVTNTLCGSTEQRTRFYQDKELSEIRRLATAMSSYFFVPQEKPILFTAGCSAKKEEKSSLSAVSDHSAVVRQHGAAILGLLADAAPVLELVP